MKKLQTHFRDRSKKVNQHNLNTHVSTIVNQNVTDMGCIGKKSIEISRCVL